MSFSTHLLFQITSFMVIIFSFAAPSAHNLCISEIAVLYAIPNFVVVEYSSKRSFLGASVALGGRSILESESLLHSRREGCLVGYLPSISMYWQG